MSEKREKKEPMSAVMVHLPPWMIEAAETLAAREDRTRGAQLRYLIRLGLIAAGYKGIQKSAAAVEEE